MKKMDILYIDLKNNRHLLEKFADALLNGVITDFLIDLGYDPKISELSLLMEKLYSDDDFNEIIQVAQDFNMGPDIPIENWNEMVSAEPIEPPDILINYNVRFKNSQPILCRDEIIRQTLSCLIGKCKPNALLIGAAGIGKTRIVEDIARMLAEDRPMIPPQIRGSTIYELPLSAVVAGCEMVGMLEKRSNR